MTNLLIEELREIEEIEEKERFKVAGLEEANWCFRKLKAIQEKEDEIKDLASKEIKRIEDWEEKELNKHKDSKEYFESLLEIYYREERVKDPKFKLSTPYGNVTSRKQQPNFKMDNEALLSWIKQNEMNDLIEIKESPKWAELKKQIVVKNGMVITEDGEIVDGVVAEEREDKVTIKVE